MKVEGPDRHWVARQTPEWDKIDSCALKSAIVGSTELSNGRQALMIDTGSFNNIASQTWFDRTNALMSAAGSTEKLCKRPRQVPLHVTGAGVGKETCTHDCEAPVAMETIDGRLVLGDYATPVLDDEAREFPAVLGLKTLIELKAIIDFGQMTIAFSGPEDAKIIYSPNTDIFKLSQAPTGHLMLPCCHYDKIQCGDADFAQSQAAPAGAASSSSGQLLGQAPQQPVVGGQSPTTSAELSRLHGDFARLHGDLARLHGGQEQDREAMRARFDQFMALNDDIREQFDLFMAFNRRMEQDPRERHSDETPGWRDTNYFASTLRQPGTEVAGAVHSQAILEESPSPDGVPSPVPQTRSPPVDTEELFGSSPQPDLEDSLSSPPPTQSARDSSAQPTTVPQDSLSEDDSSESGREWNPGITPGQGARPVEDLLYDSDHMEYDHTRQDADQDMDTETCVACGQLVDLESHGWSAAGTEDGVVCLTCGINARVNAMDESGMFPTTQSRRRMIQMMIDGAAVSNALEQGGSARAEGWTGDMHERATNGIEPGTRLVPQAAQDPQTHFLRSIGDYVRHSAIIVRDEDEAADDPGASSSGLHREGN